jgi:tRNA G18 (ribose-2'-O)-methylase SpoU
VANAADVVCEAKGRRHWVVVAELSAASVTLAALRPGFGLCFTAGVSADVLACADQTVTIPMLGIDKSLNVATAGASSARAGVGTF